MKNSICYVSKDIKRMIQNLNHVFPSNRKYFIFPPESSFNKAPKHRWIGARKLGQSNKRLWKFNNEISEFLMESEFKSWKSLNLTALTSQVISCDGCHYGYEVFRTVLTIFLNSLDENL